MPSLTLHHKRSLYVAITVTVLWAAIAADLFFNRGSLFFSLGWAPKSAETMAFVCSPFVLGLIVFYLEKRKRTLQSRVSLMLDARDLSNPRLGAEWSLSTLMENVRRFYGADGFFFIDLEGDSHYRIRLKTSGIEQTTGAESIGQECASRLLVVPETHAFVLNPSGIPILRPRYVEYDRLNQKATTDSRCAVESLAVMLEAESIVSVPVFRGAKVTGRIFITSRRSRFFSTEDPVFLSRFLGQHLALIENLRLVDNLAAAATEQERKHIALDLHDSVVQPYIGIQMGLSAIQRKVHAGRTDISEDLERVATMAELEVHGLRRYVGELSASSKSNGQFLPAIQRLTEKFAATTGIAVELRSDTDINFTDRLAGEAFQMIAEGLSNIRRHTAASKATIEIDCDEEHLNVRIANNGRAKADKCGKFIPKSITSRAESLGGEVRIDLNTHDHTVLNIGIPFQG